MKEINEAYQVLGDETKRKQYNRYGKAGASASGDGGFGQEIEFGDIFDDIFDIFGKGGKKRANNTSTSNEFQVQNGADILINLSLGFKEAVLGTTKKLTLELEKSCSQCKQTGAYSSEHIVICSSCHGSGVVVITQRSLFGNIRTQSTCPNCRGHGLIISKKCEVCHGRKFIKKSEIITVKIPRGIQPGQKLSLRNIGNDGWHGGKRGDIYFEIKIEKHNYFQRKDNDIHVSVPISFLDAILGNSVEIITLEGLEKVKVPTGTQNGDYLILSQRGCYLTINGSQRGSFYIWWQIRLPRKISLETTEVLKRLSESHWNPNKEFIEKNKELL